MQIEFTLDGRSFAAASNDAGVSSSDTIFTYHQEGSSITGEYKGGDIEFGNIVGQFVLPNTIELLFQCRTQERELLSGRSLGKIQKNNADKLEIKFEWHWLSGKDGSGESLHKEI